MVRKRRPASTVPDVIIAFAAVGWTMALLFVIASFLDPDITEQEAGPVLARIFAASLATCATFVFVLGIALLRDDRNDPSHYIVPMIVGFLVGMIATSLFIQAVGAWVFAPFVLLVFTLRPVRRAIARALGRHVVAAVAP